MPPLAVSKVLSPEQMEVFPLIAGIGAGFTVTTVLVSLLQNPLLTLTEYVVLTRGDTIILLVVAPLLQEYLLPPEALRVIVLPSQIV